VGQVVGVQQLRLRLVQERRVKDTLAAVATQALIHIVVAVVVAQGALAELELMALAATAA
jgi:predicted DNA-binding protein with PD1-like motif